MREFVMGTLLASVIGLAVGFPPATVLVANVLSLTLVWVGFREGRRTR